jgi:hypothetical protein
MKAYILLLLLFVLTFPSILFSQEKEHPIEIYLDSCMEKDPSTFGSIHCMEKAANLWMEEISKYKELLLGILDEESGRILNSAQSEWFIYKEKEFVNIDRIYSKIEGTMFKQFAAAAKLEIVQKRAEKLLDYYNTLLENEYKK